ncbi:MAG: insulinase family protein [Proteobacteria bacterium]|nr:insulinase family protein [Pseudomonadota bacterium]
MKNQFFTCFLFVGLFLYCSPSYGEEYKPTDAKVVLAKFAEGVQKITLKNGLRILVYPRKDAPVFAGQVWVKVGGVNESLGSTGAAHLLEHMAFKGSETIGTKDYAKEKPLLEQIEAQMKLHQAGSADFKKEKLVSLYKELSELWLDNEFSRIYQKRGGVGLNAGTAKDYTMYTIELPKSELELWCWMESDRLMNPVFRQFYKEREVVMEERRMRTDDEPSGMLYEALLATAYWIHPYHFPTIGWRSDINSLTTDKTKALHDLYYRPDNIVLSIVGDIDIEQARPLFEKYFSRLKNPSEPLPQLTVEEGKQNGEKRVEVLFDAEPMMMMAYHKPVYPDEDDLRFSILHTLLAGGRSSILYKDFVLKRQLALSIGSSEAPGELYPSLFYISAVPRQGVTNEKLLEEIQKSLDRIAKEGFSDEDFAAAKKRVKLGFLNGLDSNDEVSEMLGHAELLWGDWQAMFKMYDIVNNAKKEEVQSLIKKYLTVENRTYAHLERKTNEKK